MKIARAIGIVTRMRYITSGGRAEPRPAACLPTTAYSLTTKRMHLSTLHAPRLEHMGTIPRGVSTYTTKKIFRKFVKEQ